MLSSDLKSVTLGKNRPEKWAESSHFAGSSESVRTEKKSWIIVLGLKDTWQGDIMKLPFSHGCSLPFLSSRVAMVVFCSLAGKLQWSSCGGYALRCYMSDLKEPMNVWQYLLFCWITLAAIKLFCVPKDSSRKSSQTMSILVSHSPAFLAYPCLCSEFPGVTVLTVSL